jgi:hypothetical protein
MKTSTLIKTIAALSIGAAFPLGAIAAPPAKMMTERGVIENVDTARQEFALKGGHLKRVATFEWNASDAVCRERQAGCSLRVEEGRTRFGELRSPREAAHRDQDRDLAERQNGSGSQSHGARLIRRTFAPAVAPAAAGACYTCHEQTQGPSGR